MSVSIHQKGVRDAGVVAVVIERIVEVLKVLFQLGSIGSGFVQFLEIEVSVPIETQKLFAETINSILQQLQI